MSSLLKLRNSRPQNDLGTYRPAAAERPGTALSAPAELVLVRGLPGSGKSTMARVLALVGFKHYEADMYFERDGKYLFDASRIKEAHAWCQKMTRQALQTGFNVVVSNTFTRLNEMEPYQSMTNNIRVIEARGNWGNLHGVSAESLERMANRWEPLPLNFGRPSPLDQSARIS